MNAREAFFGSDLCQRIAREVFAGGVKVRCRECAASRELTEEEAAGALAKGWPRCCGWTMGIEEE